MEYPYSPEALRVAALLVFALGVAFFGVLAQTVQFVRSALLWLREDPLVRGALVIVLLAFGPITLRSKNFASMRPPQTILVSSPVEPMFYVVSVSTNGVVFRAASSNAVEHTAWRLHGASKAGFWLDADAPFFSIGTNPVSRCYVAASGSVSFESMRRPPVGAPLPDGTVLPVLCPLRAPLGMVPEANWTIAGAQSRLWHEVLPGGGRVLTWENALMDRLPGRRVSIQVELHPSGDGIFRYDFHDALDPPATNFVMGAQMGTNGVNALAILGTNVLSATVWNVDGRPVTNGVSIADLLCTNGVLRTPATFEIEWKNTTGIDPGADTDNDGLTDWAETFLWGTDRNHADTDGDGIADNVELMMDANPFDADEDGNGVPDGTSESEWLANPLWAANTTNGVNVVITLNEAVPANSSATLVVGDLAIPLRSPAMWTISLEPGQMYDFRLHTLDNAPVDISLSPPTTATPRRMAPLRAPASPPDDSGQSPLWQNPKNALNGPTRNTSGQLAVPELELIWIDSGDGSHVAGSAGVCLHSQSGVAMFRAEIRPNGTGVTEQDLVCEGMGGSGTRFGLFVSAEPGAIASGSVSFAQKDLRWGHVTARATVHRAMFLGSGAHCAICNGFDEHINDVSLYVRSPLTLKHDNETDISFHCEQSGHGSASNPVILIRRAGTTDWNTLAESFQYEWTARIAGFFELKGVAQMDGVTVETTPVEIEVRFPSYGEIVADPDVESFTESIWTQTKNAHRVDSQGVTHSQEFACWIYLDTVENEYFNGFIVEGLDALDDDQGGTWVGSRPNDQPIHPSPLADGAIYPVCHFHTHTPMTYRPSSSSRPVGSSPEDRAYCNENQVPGMLYDYLPAPGFPPQYRIIPGGTPKDAAAEKTGFGIYERRPTP